MTSAGPPAGARAGAAAPGRSVVGRWMIAVAVVAVNLGGALTLPRDPSWRLPAGVAPAALTLQAAAFRLARSHGRWRAFWAGFVTAGSVAVASFAWAMIAVPRHEHWCFVGEVRLPGPPWATYDAAADEWLTTRIFPRIGPWIEAWPWEATSRLPVTMIEVSVYALPQLLIALGGGLLALLIRQAWRRFNVRRPG